MVVISLAAFGQIIVEPEQKPYPKSETVEPRSLATSRIYSGLCTSVYQYVSTDLPLSTAYSHTLRLPACSKIAFLRTHVECSTVYTTTYTSAAYFDFQAAHPRRLLPTPNRGLGACVGSMAIMCRDPSSGSRQKIEQCTDPDRLASLARCLGKCKSTPDLSFTAVSLLTKVS